MTERRVRFPAAPTSSEKFTELSESDYSSYRAATEGVLKRLQQAEFIEEEKTMDENQLQQGAGTPATPNNLPLWRCHKIVEAFRIREIRAISPAIRRGGITGPLLVAALVPDEEGINYVEVSKEYMDKHQPKTGGYYVRYPRDGYESYSPYEPFQFGYTRLSALSSERAMEQFRNGGPVPEEFATLGDTPASQYWAKFSAKSIAEQVCAANGHNLILDWSIGSGPIQEGFCTMCGLTRSEIRSGVMKSDGKPG
jgi:hypothetical protein